MKYPRRHTCWWGKRLYWKGVAGQKAGGSENAGELLCHITHCLRFYGDEVSFWVVSGQSFWLRVLPGSACPAQPRWMPLTILGGGRTCSNLLLIFPKFFWLMVSYWYHVSYRTSYCKITHTNGYYGAWPRWAISVSVFPLTVAWIKMRESCGGNQQPAQLLHMPTALTTEGLTGFKVSDSWC